MPEIMVKKSKKSAASGISENKMRTAVPGSCASHGHGPLIDLDSDDILAAYGNRIADRRLKKKLEMKVSGKSVFKIKDIIAKKHKDGKVKM